MRVLADSSCANKFCCPHFAYHQQFVIILIESKMGVLCGALGSLDISLRGSNFLEIEDVNYVV